MPESQSLGPAINAPLGYRTVGGAAWGVAQVVFGKLLQFLSLLILASFVTPEQFGAAAIAISISTFAPILNPTAVGDYLVQRARAPQGSLRGVVWSGVGISIAGGVLLTAIAPWAASSYGSAAIAAPLMFIAWKPLADMLAVVPQSRLRSDLRFKRIAVIDSSVLLGTTALSIVLALAGAGALSIIVPLVLASTLRALAYSLSARSSPAPGAEADSPASGGLSQVGFAVVAGIFLVGSAQYVHTALNAVDWTMVGWLLNPAEAGLYYFAWNLSIQSNAVLASQLGQTLQPILGRLVDEPKRMAYGYIRALRLLAAVAVPVSLLQAAVSGPLFHVLFGEKWDSARGVFMVLSCGQAVAFAVGPTMAVIKAQGRWLLLLVTQVIQLAFVVVTMLLMSRAGGAPERDGSTLILMAAASSLQYFVFCPLVAWLAVRRSGARVLGLFKAFYVPMLAALPGAAAVFLACEALDARGIPWQLTLVCVGGLVGVLSYGAAIRFVDPVLWADFAALSQSMRRRIAGYLGRRVGGTPGTGQASPADRK